MFIVSTQKLEVYHIHQNAVKGLLHLNTKDYKLDVVIEPLNPYDPNAMTFVANVCIRDRHYKLKL